MNINNSPLHQYKPPSWASPLKNIPQYFVKLAQRNTPIHPWNIPNLPKEFSLSVKRDDLTGCALSGNKTTDIGCKGNLLLSRIVGSRVILVPQLKSVPDLEPMMKKMVDKLRQQGSSPYLIEIGCSSYTGMFGYLTAFQEMMNQ
ncbi:hypothetical protein OS493_038019, partial [Desmophyllum pertusum]